MRISPTTVRIDLKALRENFRMLRRRVPPDMKILATVKSNAYGHGAVPVAKTLQEAGANLFGVGTVDEGVELRRAGIRRPILVLLGLVEGAFDSLLKNRLTPVLYDLRTAQRLDHFLHARRRSIDVHLKVDTGMTRLGFLSHEAPQFFSQLSRLRSLRPVGLLSHLADADQETFTRRQQAAFQTVRQLFTAYFPASSFFHLNNSLASIDRRRVGNMVRLGIALYGAAPIPRQRRTVSLKPVLSWTTRVVTVKTVPRGTAVSYGRRYRTKRKSFIGILPVGYADGYPRNLSNRGEVLIRGRRVPVAGTICMDMMMVDLTKVPGARKGDEVVLIGRQGGEEIRAEELAERSGTISYEIFCQISGRNQRVIQR